MDSRPLILHLRATNFVGGPERQILEHLNRMREGRYRLALCTFDEDGRPSALHEAARIQGIECHRLSSKHPLDPRGTKELSDLIRGLCARLLVTHGYKPNLLGRLACWDRGITTWAVSRGWTAENLKGRLYENLDRLFLRFADKVVAVSHGQRDKVFKAGISKDKVLVIHNAIDLADVPEPDPSLPERRRLGIPAEAMLFGTAGRFSPEKNHMGFIEAAADVLRQRPDAHFIIWGEGFMRPRLEQAIREYGLEGRFHLPGFSKNVRGHFHELDVFVLPSHTEGLSNVLLEAFACAKPAVATAVGGNPEVVEHGVSGLLTPAGDTPALARAMLELAESPTKRAEMGNAGRLRVARDFTFESQTEKYEELYSTLLSGKRAME